MGVPQSITLNFRGEETTFYYIGYLANALGRTPQTVRKWEIAEIIPKTPFKDAFGRRLYLKEHIDAVVELAEQVKISQGKTLSGTRFGERLQRKFDEIHRNMGIGGNDNAGKET